jgi:hypothetical protein
MPGAVVYVYTDSAGTVLATLYTDDTKATTTTNPVSVDARGNLTFFAEPGLYYIKAVVNGNAQALLAVEAPGDPREAGGSAVTTHEAAADPHGQYLRETLIDAKGDLLVGSAADTASRLAAGTDGHVLMLDSTQATGAKWAAPPGAGSGIAETLIDAKGDLIAGSAADTAARLAVGSNGQVLTAASGQATGLQWATPATVITDHGGLTGLSDDDHPQYVLKALADAKGDLFAASAADTLARLAVGTNGQVLTAASGQATGMQWADPATADHGGLGGLSDDDHTQYVKRIAGSVSTVSVVNTTSEGDLVSASITGGILAAGDMLRLRAHGDMLNNSGGGATFVPKVKYGATTILTTTARSFGGPSATRGSWHLAVWLFAETTTAQRVACEFRAGELVASGQLSTTDLVALSGVGVAAEDSSGTLNLKFTTTLSAAHASLDMRCLAFSVERVKA